MSSTPPEHRPEDHEGDTRVLVWVIVAGCVLLLAWIALVLLAFVG